MKKALIYWIYLILFSVACRNTNVKHDGSGNVRNDSVAGFSNKINKESVKSPKSGSDTMSIKSGLITKKESKTIEVEIAKINPKDTFHKMSYFHNEHKYFHKDSLYCELIYNLNEVERLIKSAAQEGDFVTMMVDERPQGSMEYYQIALYRVRLKLDKMDRLDSYRINATNKQIEKLDVVKDQWVIIK